MNKAPSTRDDVTHDLRPEVVPIAALHPHPMNARRGNVQVIADSLARNGQFRTVLVNRGTHTGRPWEIVAGHHLVLAAQALGWTDVKCSVIDVDDQQCTAILLADNRTTDLATYDDRALLELLRTMPDLTGTGYAQADLDALEAVLREHVWEDESVQDVLDKADADTWPEVRCKLAPALHERFLQVQPDGDDADRIMLMLERFWESDG